jgi:hypothetical protein
MSYTSQAAYYSQDRSVITSLLAEVNEAVRHSRLSANITKLAPDAEEEVALLAEGTSIFTCDIFLQMHIGIRDFGDQNQTKEDD